MSRPNKPKVYPAQQRCQGKICYPTKHDAETVKLEQELRHPDLELAIYRCQTCQKWHLTRSAHPTT